MRIFQFETVSILVLLLSREPWKIYFLMNFEMKINTFLIVLSKNFNQMRNIEDL